MQVHAYAPEGIQSVCCGMGAPNERYAEFQRHYSSLFGLPNVVSSFDRWFIFAQALVRRLLMFLFSMYFDGCHANLEK